MVCMLAFKSGYSQLCSAVSVPYSENFESVTTPNLPECTLNQNVGTGNNWITSVPGGNGFTTKTLTYQYSLEAANTWFFTKGLNLTAGTSYRLTYKYGNNGYTESLKVAYGTANNAAAMVTQIADQPAINNPEGPITKIIDFTPATTGVYYLGFNIYSIGNQNSLFIDDITLDVSPSCIEPTALALSAILENGVTLSWTAATTAPANGYEYYIGTTNAAPTDATTATGSVGAGVVTANATGLTPSTTYYVWVRSNCGAGSHSSWTGPETFGTSCDYGDVLTTTAGSICGQGQTVLHATANAGAVLKWYTGATDGFQIGQGPDFTTPYILQTTTYYVSAGNPIPDSGDTCNSPRVAVTATVTPGTPIVATAANPGVCTGGSTTLSVTSTDANYVYTWYPGGLVGATQTVSPTATTTYTVIAIDAAASCSVSANVTVTVNAFPSAVTITPAAQEVCAGTPQLLTATGGTIAGEATIGTATTETEEFEQPTAFCNRWPNYWSQTIYTAAELTAAGLTQGNITSIAFDVTSLGSGASNPNYTVKIGGTTATAFADENYLSTDGFTTVYGPDTYVHTASGWQVITFTTPYVWDGVSNIVVNITHDGLDQSSNTQTYYTETTDNTVIWQNSYGTTTTSGNTSNKRLNVKFTSVVPTAVTWSPVNHLYTNAAATTPYVEGTAATTVYFRSSTAATTTYTATATSPAGCTAVNTVDVTVNVTETPAATAQSFCNAATVADLTATGTAIQWYTVGLAGTPLAASTPLATGTYYASQTVNGCESPIRIPVAVQINVTPAPTAAAAQTFCNTATVASLIATETGVQWFTTATGGTALTADTALTSGTVYYASQTNNGCESTRTAVTATITVVDAPTGAATQTINANTAANATIDDIVVTGTTTGIITWYATEANALAGENAIPAGTPITAGTYYATQTVDGCASAMVLAVTVEVVLGTQNFDTHSFTYYPNPVSNVLTISYSSEITSVSVVNLLGQQILTAQPNSTNAAIDLTHIASGTYLVNVTAGATSKTIKIVKN